MVATVQYGPSCGKLRKQFISSIRSQAETGEEPFPLRNIEVMIESTTPTLEIDPCNIHQHAG